MTGWHPYTNLEPMRHLLENGEVVSSPPMEVTDGGRRVRLRDDPDTAMWAKDVDELMLEGAKLTAKRRGTKLWMRLSDSPEDVIGGKHKPELNPAGASSTSVWWHFRHDTLPIDAFVTVNIQSNWNGAYLRSNIHVPITTYQHNGGTNWTTWDHLPNVLPDYEMQRAVTEAMRADVFDVLREISVEQRRFPKNSRKVYGEMLRLCEEIDALAELPVLDLRDPKDPSMLPLTLLESGYTGEFREGLIAIVEGTPLLEKASDLYDELRLVLRQLGLNIGSTDDQFAKVLAGDDNIETIPLGPLLKDDDVDDSSHVLHVHPVTGTLYIQCHHDADDNDKIAERWEEAKTMASLTGELDTLLAYAQEYTKDTAKKKAREIARKRDPR